MLNSKEQIDRFLNVRKKVIASDFSSLNDKQLEAVMTTEGPLLVLAGAGSGKTTVLIQRIANVVKYGRASDSDEIPSYIDESDIDFLETWLDSPNDDEREAVEKLCELDCAKPWSVIAITFTNKAAGELKERLSAKLGKAAEDIWASTFHSACVRILRRYIDRLGYDNSFTIYDSSDSERLMKSVLSDLRIEEQPFSVKSVLKAVSVAKDNMIFPDEYMDSGIDSNKYRASRVAGAYYEYQRRMKEANALDFDDIILLTVTILLKHEDVREYYQNKFRYVLVDEYQDTNNLQYILARTLAGGYNNLCVVGDDDQSIYRFRGATVENILSFERQYPNARVIKLEQNYRSTGSILSAANGVIGNNTSRKDKHLWTSNSDGEPVTIYSAYDDSDEADFIARTIFAYVEQAGHFSDCAVLYRMNAQMNRIEDAFKRHGIPYRVIGGTRFFDRAEIKDILSYMCVIHNLSDDLRLSRIVNNPTRGIGAKAMENVAYYANISKRSLFDILDNAADYPELQRSAVKMSAFTKMIYELRDLSVSLPLPDFYDALLENTGYMRMMKEKSVTDKEMLMRIENVRELKSNIVEYSERTEEPSIGGFLDEVALFTDIEKYDDTADAAVMMTMHSAKGLEFPIVFLPGFEEGLFPGNRSMSTNEDIEEERRLCYVGITRAKSKLYVICARQRMLFGRTSFNHPSRFVAELPEDCVEMKKSRMLPEERNRTGRRTADYTEADQRRYQGSYSKHTANIAKLDLRKGDTVMHTTFGKGMVTNIKPTGGDALLEVAFDAVGTKHLMLGTASRYLTKLTD